MKSLAIISNGPSAITFNRRPHHHDVVAGVALAATRWSVDWWVFCDAQTYLDHRAIVLPAPDRLPPRLFARQRAIEGVETITHRPVRPGERILYHEDILPPPGFITPTDPRWNASRARLAQPVPHDRRWNEWSGIAAMGLAWHLRQDVNVIDLYGFDLAGTRDFQGQDNTSRDPERWSVELAIMEAWVARLQGAGMIVRWPRSSSM